VEYSEPDLERMARRVRRVVWAFRLIFYPGALVVALLLLSARSSGDVPSTWLDGRTDQRHSFTMRLDDDRPAYLKTTVVATCADGDELTRVWRMRHRPPDAPFVFDDHTLSVTMEQDVVYDDGQNRPVTMRLRARVEDDSVTGKMWMVTRRGSARPYDCEAGPVSFSAAAG
jgi:hypothetical protein